MNLKETRILQLEMQRKKTNHIFHFLMCIPTVGLWVIVWLICGFSNTIENWGIDHKINQLYKPEGDVNERSKEDRDAFGK